VTRHRTLAIPALVSLVLAGLPHAATAQGAAGEREPIAAEPEGYALRYETDRIILLAREGEPNASRLATMAAELGLRSRSRPDTWRQLAAIFRFAISGRTIGRCDAAA
jgi:hypothetical protein